MRQLGIQEYFDDRERTTQELAARPRLDRAVTSGSPIRRWIGELIGPTPVRPLHPADRLTIRAATTGDRPQLVQLAELTERHVPEGPVLVAQVDTELIAAVPVAGGEALIDIRRGTADVVQLLELRSKQLRRAWEDSEAA